MALSKHNVLVLLGVVASIQAAPAPLPKPDVPAPRQITLNPPSYSISWDPPLPTQSTPDSTDPENPGYTPTPVPQPSDQISLSPPSYSISWDGPQVPSSATTPDEPAEPTPQLPTPSNQISLTPPSYSISWDGPAVPTPSTTTKPGWPHWTPKPKTSSQAKVSASVSWNKRQEDGTEPTDTPDPEDPENPQDPGDGGPIVIPPSFPTPGNSLGIQPPQVSISWGKRDVAEAEATPPPSIGLGNPTYSFWWPKPPKHTSGYISWGKRQDETEPTDSFPDPTQVLPPIFPQPSDQISYNTPSASISWGKRDGADAEYPPPTWWLGNPTASLWWPQPPKHTSGYISWGKRQDDGPTEITAPIPTPTDQISVNPPSATVSWGKRQDDGPTEITPPVQTPPNQISINPPAASISWGKRDGADYPPPTWWLGQPTGWISWDKRDVAAAEATAAPSIGLGEPNYSVWWPKPAKSSAYVSWGKREAEAQADTVGLVWPTNIPKPTWDVPLPPLFTPPTYVSWGKREDEHKPKPTGPAEVPTTLATLTSAPTKPTPSACPTVTKTMALPCIPPMCPDSLIACKPIGLIGSAVELEQRDEAKVREIEKTIVTIKTVKPSYAPTATVIDKCTPVPTVTEYAACPTYTCVPECPEALRM